MGNKAWRKVQTATYRFWVEYHQFIEGSTTRRMKNRANRRKAAAGDERCAQRAPTTIPGLWQLDLAGI